MQTVAHLDFIIGAYAGAIVIVGGLIAWVMLDYRVQRSRLAALEKRGFTRRTASAQPESAAEQAREDA